MGKAGGKREGAGRKPKADEQKLVEKLKPYDDKVLKVLMDNVMDNESWAVKMFMDYRFGKPVEHKNLNIKTDVTIDMSEWE